MYSIIIDIKDDRIVNQREIDRINQTVNELDSIMGTLYRKLAGARLTEETLAAAVSDYLPDMSSEQLMEDCSSLRTGIQKGNVSFESFMSMPDEELDTFLPNQLKKELETMSEEQGHQYLLLLCQLLYEKAGHDVSSEEAVYIANISNEQLLRKVSCLMQKEQAEISTETAEFLHDGLKRIQMASTHPEKEMYTEDENTWIASAAVYIMERKNTAEKIPAEYIGEQMGFTKCWLSKFKESMLTKIIPAAVSVLAVVGVAALLFYCFKLLIANSLFMTVVSYLKKNGSLYLCQIGAVCLAAQLLQFVAESTFTEAALLTSKIARDNARSLFEKRSMEIDQSLEIPELETNRSINMSQQMNQISDSFFVNGNGTIIENSY